ncbi:hypothetical protein GCM10029978_076420 [Actinoallomurus acanthiterrae]
MVDVHTTDLDVAQPGNMYVDRPGQQPQPGEGGSESPPGEHQAPPGRMDVPQPAWATVFEATLIWWRLSRHTASVLR